MACCGMKLRRFLFFMAFTIMVGCTTIKTDEQNMLLVPTAIVESIPPTRSFDSDASLAEAMMLVYPDDRSENYIIAGDNFFPGGTEITFEFEDIAPDSIASLTTVEEDAISPNGMFRAFVACEYDNCQPRLFVENLTDSSQLFEVTFSMRMPWRPLDRLAWVDDNVLAFSQFSNPHYGFRYAIDVDQRKYLLTLVLVDECFKSGDCGN